MPEQPTPVVPAEASHQRPAPPPPSAPAIPDAPANQLTPEEQMALFAQELKETDWGHQPC